jgi:aminopeptidase N
VALVVAHEVAHSWFGDLVTLRDWDELWLNEGFATYFESVGARFESGRARRFFARRAARQRSRCPATEPSAPPAPSLPLRPERAARRRHSHPLAPPLCGRRAAAPPPTPSPPRP